MIGPPGSGKTMLAMPVLLCSLRWPCSETYSRCGFYGVLSLSITPTGSLKLSMMDSGRLHTSKVEIAVLYPETEIHSAHFPHDATGSESVCACKTPFWM